MTQTYIFINSIQYAKKIQEKLTAANLASHILHSQMDNADRDNIMAKFRNREINVLITTNIISRGIDIPEAQLVINFDIPVEFKYVYDKGQKPGK